MFVDPISLSRSFLSQPPILDTLLKQQKPHQIVLIYALPRDNNELDSLQNVPLLKPHGTQLAKDHRWFIVWISRPKKKGKLSPAQFYFGGFFPFHVIFFSFF